MWRCACGLLHEASQAECPQCGNVRPHSLDPLPDEQAERLRSLLDWLDSELARRPSLLTSGVGLGLTQLVNVGRRDPSSLYRTIMAALPALNATQGWTERGEAADPDAFALLGEPER